jgi:hypothetical protein
MHFAFFDSPSVSTLLPEAFMGLHTALFSEKAWLTAMSYDSIANEVNQPIVYASGASKFDAWDRMTTASIKTGYRLNEPVISEPGWIAISQVGRDGSHLLYEQFPPYLDEGSICHEVGPDGFTNDCDIIELD